MTTCRNSLKRCQDGLGEKENMMEDMYNEQSKCNQEKYTLRRQVRQLEADKRDLEAKIIVLELEVKGLTSDLSVCYGHGPIDDEPDPRGDNLGQGA